MIVDDRGKSEAPTALVELDGRTCRWIEHPLYPTIAASRGVERHTVRYRATLFDRRDR
jgi:hypothetical protein